MEDKMEITLFKKKALICKEKKKFDLELFSDIAVKHIPVFECTPFLHMPRKSRELFEKSNEEERKGGGNCFVYAYKVTPQSLNRDDLIALQRKETDEKTGGDVFAEYRAWKEEQEKKLKDKNKKYDPNNQIEKPYFAKKVLVQYRIENTGDKNFQLNIYLCWLVAWCGTLAYQDPEERDFLVHQAIEVLKKMVYKVDPNPQSEIFELMMDSAFQHGDENMVAKLFEIYSEEFKLQQNNTMIQLMLNAKGKGLNLAKRKILAITDVRRSAIPQMEQEIVEDLTELEMQDRQIAEERNKKQC